MLVLEVVFLLDFCHGRCESGARGTQRRVNCNSSFSLEGKLRYKLIIRMGYPTLSEGLQILISSSNFFSRSHYWMFGKWVKTFVALSVRMRANISSNISPPWRWVRMWSNSIEFFAQLVDIVCGLKISRETIIHWVSRTNFVFWNEYFFPVEINI